MVLSQITNMDRYWEILRKYGNRETLIIGRALSRKRKTLTHWRSLGNVVHNPRNNIIRKESQAYAQWVKFDKIIQRTLSEDEYEELNEILENEQLILREGLKKERYGGQRIHNMTQVNLTTDIIEERVKDVPSMALRAHQTEEEHA